MVRYFYVFLLLLPLRSILFLYSIQGILLVLMIRAGIAQPREGGIIYLSDIEPGMHVYLYVYTLWKLCIYNTYTQEI